MGLDSPNLGTVTVIGATGLVGREVRHVLSEVEGAAVVNVFTRTERHELIGTRERRWPFPDLDFFADAWEQPGRFDALVDLVAEALPPGDTLVSCLGTTRRAAGSAQKFRFVDFAINAAFARAAAAGGYRRYGLISSYGADASSRWLYTSTKGELEEFVTALDFDTLRIARPGLLRGERRTGRLGERAAARLLAAATRMGLSTRVPYAAVDARLVAGALVNALEEDRPAVRILLNADMYSLFEAHSPNPLQ